MEFWAGAEEGGGGGSGWKGLGCLVMQEIWVGGGSNTLTSVWGVWIFSGIIHGK